MSIGCTGRAGTGISGDLAAVASTDKTTGAVFGAYRQGGHLAPERAVAGIGFEEYLAERVERRGTSQG